MVAFSERTQNFKATSISKDGGVDKSKGQGRKQLPFFSSIEVNDHSNTTNKFRIYTINYYRFLKTLFI
jgi:hypothetical protein